LFGRYSGVLFQIDPIDPPPQRGIRWPSMVTGFCLIVVAAFLLVVYTVVGAATSGSGFACSPGSSPCISTVIEYVFLVPGLLLLVVGAVVVVLSLRYLARVPGPYGR
jgi:uncharacterized membrane protein